MESEESSMKKIIISLLIMVILLPTLSVSAASISPKNDEFKKTSNYSNERWYNTDEIYYEVRDSNGYITQEGNLSNKIKPFADMIIDSGTINQYISIPRQGSFTFYPKDLGGFYWGPGVETYLFAMFNDYSLGHVRYEFVDRGALGLAYGAPIFNGDISLWFTTAYNWTVPYKITIMNLESSAKRLAYLSLSETIY